MKFSGKVRSDHGMTWFNFGSIWRNGAMLISLSAFVNITSKWLDRFSWNFQGRCGHCGVIMGWPDYILVNSEKPHDALMFNTGAGFVWHSNELDVCKFVCLFVLQKQIKRWWHLFHLVTNVFARAGRKLGGISRFSTDTAIFVFTSALA